MAGEKDTRDLEEAWHRGEARVQKPAATAPADDEPDYIAPRRRRLVVKPHFWFLFAAAGAFFLWDGWEDLAYWLSEPRATEIHDAAAARDNAYATVAGTLGPRRGQYRDREVLVLLHSPFMVERESPKHEQASRVLPAYHGAGRLRSIASAGASVRDARDQLALTGDVPAEGELWVLFEGETPRQGFGTPVYFLLLALMVLGGLAKGAWGLFRPDHRPSRTVRFGAPMAAALALIALTACPRQPTSQQDAGDDAAADSGAADAGADAGGTDGGATDPGGPALSRVSARTGWKSIAAVSGANVLYRLEVTQTSHQLFLVDTSVSGGAEVAPFPGEATDKAIALDGRVAYAAVATTFTTREIARWDAATSTRAQIQAPTGELVFDLRARNGVCAWRQGPVGGAQSLRLWTPAAGVRNVAEGVTAVKNLWLTDAHLVWAFSQGNTDWVGAAPYTQAGPGTRLADVKQSDHFMRGVMPLGQDLVFYMYTGCATAPDCPLDLARMPIGGAERTVTNNALPEPETGAFAVASGKVVFINHSPLRPNDPYAVQWVALGAGAATPATLVASAPRKIEGMATDGRRVVFIDWSSDPDGKWIFNDEENDPALYLSDAAALQ